MLGAEGAVGFWEFGFDDLRDCRDIKVIVRGIVGDDNSTKICLLNLNLILK
jgi:hypothetical protein